MIDTQDPEAPALVPGQALRGGSVRLGDLLRSPRPVSQEPGHAPPQRTVTRTLAQGRGQARRAVRAQDGRPNPRSPDTRARRAVSEGPGSSGLCLGSTWWWF